MKRIGILTGGGDVPGLNSIIKSVVYRGREIGWEILGIRRGWMGLTHLGPAGEGDAAFVRPLTRENTRAIDRTSSGDERAGREAQAPEAAHSWHMAASGIGGCGEPVARGSVRPQIVCSGSRCRWTFENCRSGRRHVT